MSHENDTWEFYQDDSDEYRWRRTASNGQIVGAANESFSSEDAAADNARLQGYEGQFSDNATFEFYTTDSGEHRWRAKASNGQNIGSASEGYSSEDACTANAERHGYSAE